MHRTYSFPWNGKAVQAIACDDMGALADWASAATDDSATNLRKAREGDAAYVAQSDAMLDLIEAASPVADTRPETLNSVTGAVPNVGAYLAGSPMSMRLRRKREERAPLNMVVDLGCHASFDNDHRARRGAALLALLRKLETAGHAIDLYYALGCGDGRRVSCILTHVDTRPLDLVRSAYALGSREYMQQTYLLVGGSLRGERESYGRYPMPGWTDDAAHAEGFYAAAMADAGKRLLVIPPAGQHVRQHFDSDKAAAAWVNEQYARAVAMAEQLH